ncbi:MAG: hypothetical protein IKB44_02745 [Clostridia bacterium]|nr:hypothetical protein [Clostridia bacterium]
MYNRYINPGFFEEQSPPPQASSKDEFFDPPSDNNSLDHEPEKNKSKGLFGGAIKLPELNADTVLMLVLVYFLISDETSPSSKEDGENKSKNNITDTLLIIGALLLLGF